MASGQPLKTGFAQSLKRHFTASEVSRPAETPAKTARVRLDLEGALRVHKVHVAHIVNTVHIVHHVSIVHAFGLVGGRIWTFPQISN